MPLPLQPSVLSFILALVFAGGLGRPTEAQEWTRFRGPNGAGQSDATTIPTKWTDNDINWKIDLPGIGHSSPVIWGDRIFVNSADPANGTRMLFAVAAKDGKVIWKRDYPPQWTRSTHKTAFHPARPRATPTTCISRGLRPRSSILSRWITAERTFGDVRSANS